MNNLCIKSKPSVWLSGLPQPDFTLPLPPDCFAPGQVNNVLSPSAQMPHTNSRFKPLHVLLAHK